MQRVLAIMLILALGIRTACAADAPTLSVNRNDIYEGESVLLTVKVPDAGEETQPDLSGIADARIGFLGSRSDSHYQVTIINGRMQREGFSGRLYSYELVPLKTGLFTAGPVRVSVNGQTFILDGTPVQVREIPRQSTVLLDLTASSDTVLPDDTFTVTLRMRVKRLDPPNEAVPPFFPDDPPQLSATYLDGNPIPGLENPDVRKELSQWVTDNRTPGIRINQITVGRNPFDMGSMFDMGDPFAERPARFSPPRRTVDVDGIDYFEYAIPLTFTARDEGAYTFGPAGLKGKILTGVDQTRRPLARDLFAVGRAVTVRVEPPPEKDRPVSFFGITGTNLTVDAQLNATSCRVGDPLKLTLKVRGPLSWRNALSPNPSTVTNLLDRFQIYGSTMQTEKTDGGRDYTFTLRPLQPGTGEIPSIPISWFDTQTRSYQTIRTAPIPLKVDPAAELTAGAWIDDRPAESSTPASAGPVSPIPSAFRGGGTGADSFSLPATLVAVAALGPSVFAGGLLLRALFAFLAVRRRGRRARHALVRAEIALKRIRKHEPGDPRETARLAFLALRDFVSDTLDREPGGLTPPEAGLRLREKGLPEALSREFEERMTRLFQASYSPQTDQNALAADLAQLDNLVRQAHRIVAAPADRFRPPSGVIPGILLILGVAGAARADDLTADRHRFEWEEAQSLSAGARTPAEFHNAAVHYAALQAEGARNGDLFYNLGVCLLLAGEPGPALRAFTRAERYLGRPRDLSHNMELARAAMNGGEPAPPSWDRIVLIGHYGVPLAFRAWLALCSFSLFWIVWSITWRGGRAPGRLVMVLSLLAFLWFGSSAAVSWFQESHEAPFSIESGGPAHAPH